MLELHISRVALLVFPTAALVVVLWGLRARAGWPAMAARVLLTGALLAIAAYTLLPFPLKARNLGVEFFPTLVPFRTIGSYLSHGLEGSEVRQVLGNVALFVPLGFALPLAVPRASRALVTIGGAATISLAVELAQMFLPLHGPDVDDVILNALGGAIGYAAFAATSLVTRAVPALAGRPPRSP